MLSGAGLANMSRPSPSLARIWHDHALLWAVVIAAALALLLSIAPGRPQAGLDYFGIATLSIFWVELLTLSGLYLARRFLINRTVLFWTALTLLLASTWVVVGMVWLMSGPSEREQWPAFAIQASIAALLAGLIGAAAIQNIWSLRESERAAEQARLAALQARIQPHFLFNTLNTAVALVRTRPGSTEQLLLDLSDLFRAALSATTVTSLADEIKLVRSYLAIESLRLGERLVVHWHCPEPLPDARVPALSLQPLVENAVRHGIERRPSGGDITIRIALADNQLRLQVSSPFVDSPARPGYGIGQQAVRARIAAFGDGSGRFDACVEGDLYRVDITLPQAQSSGEAVTRIPTPSIS